MLNSYAKGEKVVLVLWFLFVSIAVSGCGNTDCAGCGFRSGQVVVVQDPNGNQTYGSAGEDGCYPFNIPSTQDCSAWYVTGI